MVGRLMVMVVGMGQPFEISPSASLFALYSYHVLSLNHLPCVSLLIPSLSCSNTI